MTDRGFVDVEGGQLYYERDGHGPGIVLMHGGILLDLRMWEPQVPALSQDNSLVRFDLRGYGRSSDPTGEPYRPVDDLRSVLDALDLGRACIGGQSLGGTIAVDFALAYPERVDALILAPALPVMGWEWVEGFPPAPALRLVRTQGVDAALAACLDLPLHASAMEIPHVAEQLRRMAQETSGWHLTHRVSTVFAAPDAIERLAEITAPALVLIGGRDVLDSRLTSQRLADTMPNSEHHLIPHVGHYPNMEDPDTTNELILSFLDQERHS